MKRLQFFIDRYIQHKKSLEIADDKIQGLISEMQNPHSELFELNNKILPQCLDFYLDSYKFNSLGRSFIVYTYPLAFKIKNENLYLLFSENQYQLENSLEKLSKFFEDHPVESFIEIKGKEIYTSKNFGIMKSELLGLRTHLETQFKNARNEFNNKHFLDLLKSGEQMIVPELKKALSGAEEVIKESPNNRGVWDCRHCTYHNVDRLENTCGMCGLEGRPV